MRPNFTVTLALATLALVITVIIQNSRINHKAPPVVAVAAAAPKAVPSACDNSVAGPRLEMRIHLPRHNDLELGGRTLRLGVYPNEVSAKEAQTKFSEYITKCVTSEFTSDWAWFCHLDLLKRTKIEKDGNRWQLYLENLTVPEAMNLCAFLWVSPEMLEIPWARVYPNTCVFRN